MIKTMACVNCKATVKVERTASSDWFKFRCPECKASGFIDQLEKATLVENPGLKSKTKID